MNACVRVRQAQSQACRCRTRVRVDTRVETLAKQRYSARRIEYRQPVIAPVWRLVKAFRRAAPVRLGAYAHELECVGRIPDEMAKLEP